MVLWLKIRTLQHWTRKGCSLWVLDPSKTSGSQTLVCAEDFFGADMLLASALRAVARLEMFGSSSELTCEPVDSGGGDSGWDSGSLTMPGEVQPEPWAPLLVLVMVMVVILGGMMEGEKVSSRWVEAGIWIYCYKLVTRGPTLEMLIPIAEVCQRDLASTYVLCPS